MTADKFHTPTTQRSLQRSRTTNAYIYANLCLVNTQQESRSLSLYIHAPHSTTPNIHPTRAPQLNSAHTSTAVATTHT